MAYHRAGIIIAAMMLHATLVVASLNVAESTDIVWSYSVRKDVLGRGIASRIVLGADGGVLFTTTTCVYDFADALCVNATGDLIRLDPQTGNESWAYRFSGAGLNGAIGLPMAPLLVPGGPGQAEQVIINGADALGTNTGYFNYFDAGMPLPNGTAGLTCDVPLASGNRLQHAVNCTTEACCENAGACWAGSTDQCKLVVTAQTVDCAQDNPEDEKTCRGLGCCWDGAFVPGRCFRGSPPCYSKSISSKGSWETPRPGPMWVSEAAAKTANVDGDRALAPALTVVRIECDKYAGRRLPFFRPRVRTEGCRVAAFAAKSPGSNAAPLWQFSLPVSCDQNGDEPCMCYCGVAPCASQPAVGGGAAFVVACNRFGMVLLGFSLRKGELLWKPQLLSLFPGGTPAINTPPAPIVSEKYGMVFVGVDADVLSHNVSIQARDVTTGAQKWALPVDGHNCTSTRWEATAAFSSTGDLLLLWDNFALRAVRAATGAEAWTSKLTNVGVHIGNDVTVGVFNGQAALLMLASRAQRSCAATITPGFLICAVAEDTGAELGCVTAPTSLPSASSLPPVAVSGDLWVHGETCEPPFQHTMVSAVKAPTANNVMFL